MADTDLTRLMKDESTITIQGVAHPDASGSETGTEFTSLTAGVYRLIPTVGDAWVTKAIGEAPDAPVADADGAIYYNCSETFIVRKGEQIKASSNINLTPIRG